MTGFSVNYQNNITDVAFNDLYLDAQGNLATVSGETEIIETCYHAIQLCLGDYDFDTSLGIPYDTYLSSDTPIGNQLKLSVTQAVRGVNGVMGINSFSLALNAQTRILQINIIIDLVSGAHAQIVL